MAIVGSDVAGVNPFSRPPVSPARTPKPKIQRSTPRPVVSTPTITRRITSSSNNTKPARPREDAINRRNKKSQGQREYEKKAQPTSKKAMGGDGDPRLKRKGKGADKTPTPAAPAKPSFSDWLAKDSIYQDALSAYNRDLANLQSEYDYNVSAANTDKTNQLGDWQTQYDRDLESMLENFAARGMANSGAFADERSRYISDQEAIKQSLIDAISRRLDALGTDLQSGKNQLMDTLTLAKRAAAERGAGQYSGVTGV